MAGVGLGGKLKPLGGPLLCLAKWLCMSRDEGRGGGFLNEMEQERGIKWISGMKQIIVF